MRIAFVTNNYTPYSGGVVSSINAFVQQLVALGHQVLIVSLDFLGDAHKDEPLVKRVASVTYFVYKKNPMAVPWRPDSTVLHYLEEFQPDVVHVHHPFLLGHSGVSAAKELGVPVLFTYHSLYEQYAHYIPLYQPWVKAAVTRRVLYFCEQVDHIIAPGGFVRDYLIERGITTPITVLPSPLRRLFFGPVCPVREAAASPVRLLVVSRLVQEKNIEGALDAVAQLKDMAYTLTVVGYGEHEQALRDYAARTLMLPQDRVKFIIRPTQLQLVDLYRSSDIFLFPSVTDTQGLVLAEAMASGVPIVALDGPGQRDIVRDGDNGYIVQSVAAMADAVRAIVADPVEHARLRHGACATAQRYHPEKLAARLVDLYLSLIDKKA